jgi:hypothetical protein
MVYLYIECITLLGYVFMCYMKKNFFVELQMKVCALTGCKTRLFSVALAHILFCGLALTGCKMRLFSGH